MIAAAIIIIIVTYGICLAIGVGVALGETVGE